MTQTPANVLATKDENGAASPLYPRSGIAGEAISAGQPLYIKATDSKLYRADANVTTAEAACVGIAVNSAAAGQFVHYWGFTHGQEINLGATLTVGQIYLVSFNVGAIMPVSDYATGHILTPLCYAISPSLAISMLKATGVTRA